MSVEKSMKTFIKQEMKEYSRSACYYKDKLDI